MTEPERTPDLEAGGGVTPGATPPAEGSTSQLADTPSKVKSSSRFSGASLVLTVIVVALVVFGVASIAWTVVAIV